MNTTNLQKLVGTKLVNEMFRCETVRKKERNDWKVLVMDRLGTKIMSASRKMHDIMPEGITLVEDLMKTREPLGTLEAVYFIQPNETSINALINDFDKVNALVPRYKAAHVFFTEACSPELFNRLKQSKCVKYIATLRELNVAFLPHERLVFTLDSPDTFSIVYGKSQPEARNARLGVIAEQIATLCSTLGEYPIVRYRSEGPNMFEFATMVQQKLSQYKADDATMGEGADKAKSVLLLLDRGFDAVTPLLHELTFQAMACDLLDIKDNIYEYPSQTPVGNMSAETKPTQKAILDEDDEVWTELRHEHIAKVLQNITKKIKDFSAQKRVKDADGGEKTTMKDLSIMIKKMPQYQKELSAYALHFNIAEQCLSAYNQASRKELCTLEQNLAMGTNAEGQQIKDYMGDIATLLLESTINVNDKLRIIMLYVLQKNGYCCVAPDSFGISNDSLDRLLNRASIPDGKKKVIANMQNLNLQILQEQNQSTRRKNIPQKRRPREEGQFVSSRWTPYVKDLMENIIDDALDMSQYPSASGQRNVSSTVVAQSTREYRGWTNNRANATRSGPRLIVFILGGVSFSEMRCAYEVTQSNTKRWEVFIGSDHTITPTQFLADLETAS